MEEELKEMFQELFDSIGIEKCPKCGSKCLRYEEKDLEIVVFKNGVVYSDNFDYDTTTQKLVCCKCLWETDV